MDLPAQLRQGIAAAKAGQREQAKQLLLQVIEADERQLPAWLWLAYVVEDLADKEVCFENILALDPDHDYAQRGLDWVRAKQGQRQATVDVSALSEPASPPGQPNLAQDIMSPEEAIAAGYVVQDAFDNAWLCPYCANLTQPEHKVCPHCQQTLLIRRRHSPERSAWLWRGFFLQAYTAVYTLSAGLAYFSAVTKWRGISNPLQALPLYLGLPVNLPPAQIDLALQTLPRPIFWAFIGLAVYSLLLMILLYIRLPFGHLLYLINAALMFLMGTMGLILGQLLLVRCVAGLGLALSAAQLFITFNLWKDFTFKENRLRLTLDSDAKTHSALYESARHYSRLKMWGMAAHHLRRAIAIQPNQLGYHLALTVAYINIKRYDLAQKSLGDAARLDPSAPEVKRLQERLMAHLG